MLCWYLFLNMKIRQKTLNEFLEQFNSKIVFNKNKKRAMDMFAYSTGCAYKNGKDH